MSVEIERYGLVKFSMASARCGGCGEHDRCVQFRYPGGRLSICYSRCWPILFTKVSLAADDQALLGRGDALSERVQRLELDVQRAMNALKLFSRVEALERDSHPPARNVPDADDVQRAFNELRERVGALEQSNGAPVKKHPFVRMGPDAEMRMLCSECGRPFNDEVHKQ